MPHPTRAARFARSIELLAIYDELRAGEPVPSIAQFALRLRLNAKHCGQFRRIVVERAGRKVPPRETPKTPEGMVAHGVVPACPWAATPMERAVWKVLASSPGLPLLPGDIYQRAAGTAESTPHDGRTVHCHVSRLRAKGARIVNTRGRGYWLVLEPAEEVAS